MTYRDTLFATLSDIANAPAIFDTGLYVLCLTPPAALPHVSVGRDGLLYIGMTEQGLEARNHFHHDHSGFSTLRRSLGALLKETLGLTAIPRAPGPSRSNTTNYRFPAEDERALSAWMAGNLRIGQVAVPAADLADLENRLIAALEPPLNLKGWDNPQRRLIKAARADCAREARAYTTP